jgi:pullulanase
MVRTLARLALCSSVALAAACHEDSSGPEENPAEIVFHVQVPHNTPAGSHVYLAGDFTDWNPASPEHELAEIAPYVYELTLSFPVGTRIEFKLTRGSWDTVEKGTRGEEVPNRVFDVTTSSVYDLTVGSWADVSTSTIAGDVTTTSVPGFLSGRRIWVYLPPGYHGTTERYPVLYMLDGQNVFDFQTSFAGEWKVDESLETLIPAGEVAPLIVVAIDNAGSSRIDEYTPWPDPGYGGGGGDAHLDAIADVLVPHVDATYRTLTGPAHTGFGGSSLGGLMALYAAYERPDVFGALMAMSPSIWWANREIVAFASSSSKPAVRVWMDMGTAEYGAAIGDLRTMRDAMIDQGFVLAVDLTVVEDPGAQHNEAAWSRRFPDAMRFLFPAP